MTIEKAVERVEWIADEFPDAEALRIVLDRAKEQRVYALGGEERKWLLDLRRRIVAYELDCEVPERYMDALASALALEKPEEPFTVEELGILHQWGAAWWAGSSPWTLAEDSLVAKLRARIEGRKEANAEPQ